MTQVRAPAVTRAVAVLRLLGNAPQALGVNAIARALDVVPSSCLHILRALSDEGLVYMNPVTKQYTLGVGLLTLAHDMLGRNHFARLAQPHLDRLALKFGVTATGVELDGQERMVVVAMAQAHTILKIQVSIGSRFPAYMSATGRCVAASGTLSRSELKKRYTALQWQSAPGFEEWLDQIEAARESGVAVDAGNYICGFTIVASPVTGVDGPQYAISIVGVSEPLSGKTLAELKRDTKEAAEDISSQLLGRG